jgi:hypothetical protein
MTPTQTGAPQTSTTTTQVPREKIAMRAYEKWMKRGCTHGHDQQDWMEAEAELRTEMRSGGYGSTSGTQTRH